jgi:hypothetical protein
MSIKVTKKAQTYQIKPSKINALAELQENLNCALSGEERISKNDLLDEALGLLFKKYKVKS